MKVVTITGSVGTGKTTLAKKLSKKLNYLYIDVNKIVKENKLDREYDKKRKCYVVDIKKLNRSLVKIINNYKKSIKNEFNKTNSIKKLKKIKKGIIIDSHLSHYLPKKYVDLCIVTKCGLKELQRRLKKKKYDKDKIRENLDCEIFNVCFNEAREAGHKVVVINTTKIPKGFLSILKQNVSKATKGLNINAIFNKIK